MNFLAHFHLAWPEEELLAGALEGDYFKGPLAGAADHPLARGVRLHRRIDAFTDEHALVRQLRRQLPPALRRYGGILIDLSFDHYLSRHWERFGPMPLPEFNRRVHGALGVRREQLSAEAQRMLARLEQHDILNLYDDWATVTATARRIGERFSRGNPFLAIEGDLAPLRDRFEDTFLAFYPELVEFSGGSARSV